MNPVPPLHVRLITPREVMLDIQADSVSSQNIQGKFDILPLHINFITLVENKPLIIRKTGEKRPLVFTFPTAIVICLDNKVDIYTYINQVPIKNF